MRAYPLVTFVTEYTSTPTLEVIPCLAFSHAHSHNLPHTHKNHPNHHKLYSSPSAILLSLKKKTPLPLPLYITTSESYLKSAESTRPVAFQSVSHVHRYAVRHHFNVHGEIKKQTKQNQGRRRPQNITRAPSDSSPRLSGNRRERTFLNKRDERKTEIMASGDMDNQWILQALQGSSSHSIHRFMLVSITMFIMYSRVFPPFDQSRGEEGRPPSPRTKARAGKWPKQ